MCLKFTQWLQMYEEVSPFHQHRWSNDEAMIQPSQDADRKPPHAEGSGRWCHEDSSFTLKPNGDSSIIHNYELLLCFVNIKFLIHLSTLIMTHITDIFCMFT